MNPIEGLACGFLWLATACAVAMLLWKPRNPEWISLRRYIFAGAVGSIISILLFAYAFATFATSISAMRPWLLGKGVGKTIVDLWLGPLGFTVGAGAAGFAVGIVLCFLLGRLRVQVKPPSE
jgi:hypothetical protein